MNLEPRMPLHAFRPGRTSAPRLRSKGSAFEPGHRHIVEVRIAQSGRWETAAYDRDEQSFHLRIGGGWMEIGSEPVDAWRQKPPKRVEGGYLADDFEVGR